MKEQNWYIAGDNEIPKCVHLERKIAQRKIRELKEDGFNAKMVKSTIGGYTVLFQERKEK